MRAALLALAVALLGVNAARPVDACINDRETQGQEREFRSSYGDPEPYRSPPGPQSPFWSVWGWSPSALIGLGVVLLAGAGGLALAPRARG